MSKIPTFRDPNTLISGKRFTCSTCGGHVLEEVMTGAELYHNLISVDKAGIATYSGGPGLKYGKVSYIRCVHCGLRIANSYKELIKLTKKRGPMFTSK